MLHLGLIITNISAYIEKCLQDEACNFTEADNNKQFPLDTYCVYLLST